MNSKPFVSEGLGANLVSSGLPKLMKRFRKHGAEAGSVEPYRPMGVGLNACSSPASPICDLEQNVYFSEPLVPCLQKQGNSIFLVGLLFKSNEIT